MAISQAKLVRIKALEEKERLTEKKIQMEARVKHLEAIQKSQADGNI